MIYCDLYYCLYCRPDLPGVVPGEAAQLQPRPAARDLLHLRGQGNTCGGDLTDLVQAGSDQGH